MIPQVVSWLAKVPFHIKHRKIGSLNQSNCRYLNYDSPKKILRVVVCCCVWSTPFPIGEHVADCWQRPASEELQGPAPRGFGTRPCRRRGWSQLEIRWGKRTARVYPNVAGLLVYDPYEYCSCIVGVSSINHSVVSLVFPTNLAIQIGLALAILGF